MNGIRTWVILPLLLAASPAVGVPVRVVATTPDIASIVEQVGGYLVEVRSIVKGDQDPHYVEPKPSFMRIMNRADLLAYVGLQLEIGWLPPLIRGARNPSIAPGGSGTLNLSEGIAVLEIPTGEVDRSEGDIHPEGNPHYWLDPRNGRLIAAAVAARLSRLDPSKADVYRAGLDRFSVELAGKIAGWERRLAGFKGMKVVTYHQQWEYLADWIGLEIVNQIEERPGIPPPPSHLSDLVEQLEGGQVRLIVYSNYDNPAIARNLSERTGVPLIVLPASVACCPEGAGYFDLFELITGRLESAGMRS